MHWFLKMLTRYLAARTGAVAVEFAVISPFVVALIVGAWDIGRLINTETTLHNLSRAGLQYAMSKYWDEDEVEAAVLSEAGRQGVTGVSVTVQATCQCSDGTVPADCSATNACGGTDAAKIYSEVKTTKGYSTTIPYPWVSTTTSLSGSAKIRVR